MDTSIWWWLLLIGLGLPLLSVLLNEATSQLARRKHPLALTCRKMRQYMLPSLGLLLIMRQVLQIGSTTESTRLVETITWLAIIVTVISLLNAILTTTDRPLKGQIQVPNLFFQVSRALVVLVVGYYILGPVWGVDLTGILTAVGVGSLGVALALQDTLSNLVSGLLLLIAQPFKPGDWIQFNDTSGRVIEQNWWSVTLEIIGNNLDIGHERRIVIPNGLLAQTKVENFGNATEIGIWASIMTRFSFDDPPNKVLQALTPLGEGIDGLIHPRLDAKIHTFEDSWISYKIYFCKVPHIDYNVETILLARIYYMAKRAGFKMPYPTTLLYGADCSAGIPETIPIVAQDRDRYIAEFLRSLPYFSALTDGQIDQVAGKAQVRFYGGNPLENTGELITKQGQVDDGLYILVEGSVKTSIQTQQGDYQEISQLFKGDLFGEMTLFSGEVSPITTVALEDVEVIVISHTAEILQFIQSNAQFATDIVQLIENRKRQVSNAHEAAGLEPSEVAAVYNGQTNATTIKKV